MEKVAVFGGSFNPPCRHHFFILQKVSQHFELVIVLPCGIRPDKFSTNIVSPLHRREMIGRGLGGIPNVRIDFSDLEKDVFTPAYFLQKRYENIFDDIWHVVGGDIVAGGSQKNSEIHRIWCNGDYIWNNLKFIIIPRPGILIKLEDMPPLSEIIEVEELSDYSSGTEVRSSLLLGEPIGDLVFPEVEKYIRKNGLYLKNT